MTIIGSINAVKNPSKLSRHVLLTTSNAETALINSLDKSTDMKTLRKLHADIVSDPRLCSDTSMAIKLMRAYACGKPDVTRKLFDGIPDRNIVICNVMIISYVYDHLYRDAISMCRTVLAFSIAPDHYTFPWILKACSASDNIQFGERMHSPAVKKMSSLSPAVTNTSVENVMFVKKIFSNMARKELVACNVMIAMYTNNSMSTEAVELYSEMEAREIEDS